MRLSEMVNLSTYDEEPVIRQAAMLVASQIEDEFGEDLIHCEHKFHGGETFTAGLVISATRELAKEIGASEYDQLVYMPAYIKDGLFYAHGSQGVVCANNFKQFVVQWVDAARQQLLYTIETKRKSMLIDPRLKRLSKDDFLGAE